MEKIEADSERPVRRERKKRYGWLLGLTLFVWALVGLMIVLVDPNNIANLIVENSYLLMAFLIFTGSFLTLSILLLSSKRAFWWSLGLIVYVYLRIWGLGNWINALLII